MVGGGIIFLISVDITFFMLCEDRIMKERKRRYTNGAKKRMKLPAKYQEDFMTQLDRRTEVYALLNTSYQNIVIDLGGKDSMSHIKHSLVERFIFMEFRLRQLEQQIIACEKIKKAAYLQKRWNGLVRSFIPLARLLGLERKAKQIESLQSYVKKDRKKNER
jgi:hypothetical protein